jgi:hypothetical protein
MGAFAFVATLFFTAPRGEAAPLICTDFDNNSLNGWTTIAAQENISVQGPTLLNTDLYLHGGDEPSPPVSSINAPDPSLYLGDLQTNLGLNTAPACLEFDYIVYNDGIDNSIYNVCPHVTLKRNVTDFQDTRAVFYCVPGVRITEPAGSNPGWHHYKLPIRMSSGGNIPSNPMGNWVISEAPNDAVHWDQLMGGVARMYFLGDIAGSPSQNESYGIDNICLTPNCDPDMVDPFPTSGGPTPSVTPVPFPGFPSYDELPCSALKKKCVAKKTTGLLGCHRKAELNGVAVNPDCINSRRRKFDGSLRNPPDPSKGCFEKAETKFPTTCTTYDDTAALELKVDAFVDDVVHELDPLYPTPVQNLCSAAKKKCVMKKANGLLQCHAKAEKKGMSLNSDKIVACFAKVQSKLPPCFADAELANPGCLTTMDGSALESKVDAFVNDVVCELDPAGGTCP